jgi:hypothetical protein
MFKQFSSIFLVLLLLKTFDCMKIKFSTGISLKCKNENNNLNLLQMFQDVKNVDTSKPELYKHFVEKIQGLVNGLERNEKNQKKNYSQMTRQCSVEINFRNSEAKDAEELLDRVLEAKQKCQDSLNVASKDLENLKESRQKYQDELDRYNKERTDELNFSNDRQTELRNAIKHAQDYSDYLESQVHTANGKVSFVQKSQNLLRHASIVGHLSETVPVLAALSNTLKSSSNSASLTESQLKILRDTTEKLVIRLNARLQEDLSTSTEAYANSNKYVVNIENIVNKLDVNISLVEQQVIDMNVCIKNEEAIEENASETVGRNEDLRKSAISMCEKFDAEFFGATKDRVQQLKMMDEMIDILNEKFLQTSPEEQIYIRKLITTFESFVNGDKFKKYEKEVPVAKSYINKTEFKNLPESKKKL